MGIHCALNTEQYISIKLEVFSTSVDLNSHQTELGHVNTNNDGDRVEKWTDRNQLLILHDSKLPSSFNSGRAQGGKWRITQI